MVALLILWAAGVEPLSDAEIDKIAGRHSWPGSEVVEKMRGSIVHRGTVPRGAAAETFAGLMAKNGIPAGNREGFDWYNAELDAGFIYRDKGSDKKGDERTAVIDEIEWTAAGTVGREVDLTAARRNALRAVEAAATRMLVDWERAIAPKLEKAVVEISGIMKAMREVTETEGKCRGILREMLKDASIDEDRLATILQDRRKRLRELAARREMLTGLVTRREEARLVLRGVLD